MKVTRTLNPLHFEDLEPHRFEDMVRQLVYDFTLWRRLEATGRAGSDSGFDARGWEIIGNVDASEEDEVPERAPPLARQEDRLWLIQCKRERRIGPRQLVQYLDEIPEGERPHLYGIIFAAACDFSKTARDAFAQRCAEFGVKVWHLWGKGELEDLLLQPKNDHLLFAYFGISLVIRQRSLKSQLRTRLASKRKAHRELKESETRVVLLRDPEDTAYPWTGNLGSTPREHAWLVCKFSGFEYDGVAILLRRHFAYLTGDDKWDAVDALNDATPDDHEDPWVERTEDTVSRSAVMQFWSKQEHHRAWFEVLGIIPYENIYDIDGIGDDWITGPHIYVTLKNGSPYSRQFARVSSIGYDQHVIHPASKEDGRIDYFPKEWPMDHGRVPPEGSDGP